MKTICSNKSNTQNENISFKIQIYQVLPVRLSTLVECQQVRRGYRGRQCGSTLCRRQCGGQPCYGPTVWRLAQDIHGTIVTLARVPITERCFEITSVPRSISSCVFSIMAIYEVKSTTSHVADVATMSKELVDKVEKTWSDLMRIIERSGLCDYLLLQAA